MDGTPDENRDVASDQSSQVKPWYRRLTAEEWKRRLWHMSPGILPFLAWPIPHADPLSPTFKVIILVLAVVLAGAIFVNFRRIARNGVHSDRLTAVAGYALSVLLTLLLFPAHIELGLTVLAVLAFGDGSATLGGILWGKKRLPWNNKKSWVGLFCFLAVGIPMAATVYWGETRNAEATNPAVSWGVAFTISAVTVLAAALAESVPSRINDNIRVGVVSAVVVTIMHGWLTGLFSTGI